MKEKSAQMQGAILYDKVTAIRARAVEASAKLIADARPDVRAAYERLVSDEAKPVGFVPVELEVE